MTTKLTASEAAALREQIAAMSDEELSKLAGDAEYLHTCSFTVTRSALQNVRHATGLTADEVETMFLDVQNIDDVNNDELTAILFAQGVKARKRSIDYAAKNRENKTVADGQAKYNRWADANPKLAANPLTNLPVMLSYGIITQALYERMMEAAVAANKENESHKSAAL
jgi:hypothetical protein